MASSMLLMPPATGAYGHLKTHTGAPLSQWNLAGDYATPGECEKELHRLWKHGDDLPVNDAIGVKPLADAETSAKCVAPDDPRVKGVIPSIGLFEPPVTDVPYLSYPDQNSPDYRASDVRDFREDSRSVRRWMTSFPGPPNQARSPDGRYQMTNVDNPDEMTSDEDWHSVFLTDMKTERKRLFYKYGRGIDISWSPFSDMIALNDYYGSNVSKSLLFKLGSAEAGIDLGEQLEKSDRPRREKLGIETADHVYPHVLKWIDRDQLLFKIIGYNGIDKEGFTLVYLYNTRKNSFILLEFLHKIEDRPA